VVQLQFGKAAAKEQNRKLLERVTEPIADPAEAGGLAAVAKAST
jgi:hypothetical protein